MQQSSTQPHSPMESKSHTSHRPLPLTRSHGQYPLGHSVLVKAEFVYADGAQKSVILHGDWNDWQAVYLNRESEQIWSVVTVIPTGHRRFYFVVDGVSKLSLRHPVEDNLNWRNVYGPTSTKKGGEWTQRLLSWGGVVQAPESDTLPLVTKRKEGSNWLMPVLIAFGVYLLANVVANCMG